MLVDEPFRYEITDFDREVFARFVLAEHPLARAVEQIDWEEFRELLEAYYSPDLGQPALDPVRMLKLEFLKYRHNLSDQQVVLRLTTDLALRYFLQVGCAYRPPDPSSLCRFRARLGAEGFAQVFDALVAQARRLGLVKDRLRLKDASHVVASIAVRSTLALTAQIRERLLAEVEPFDPQWVVGQRIETDLLRARTQDQADEARLAARVTHLQELTAWAEQLPAPDRAADPTAGGRWDKLQKTLALARKILQDRQPGANRKTLSVHDPEARRGKHGEYYDGYLTDILIDAESEIITQINVLEAGGDEARDALDLVRAEQAAHGNQIENVSLDGAGFHGEMLREMEGPAVEGPAVEGQTLEGQTLEGQTLEGQTLEGQTLEGQTLEGQTLEGQTLEGQTLEGQTLEGQTSEGQTSEGQTSEGQTLEGQTLEGQTSEGSAAGLGVRVFVPPKAEPADGRFSGADFRLQEDAAAVVCPAGETSRYRQREADRNATIFRFTREQCAACPLQARCLAKPPGRFGRSVRKNDYEAEYARARQRAQTEEYAAVRQRHPAVERKLNELLNHHGGRRARYWGRAKVHVQQLMTGFVVNAKRIVKLLAAPRAEPRPQPTN